MFIRSVQQGCLIFSSLSDFVMGEVADDDLGLQNVGIGLTKGKKNLFEL